MASDRTDRITEIFNAVLECEPDKRKAFLEDACAGDPSLKEDVLSLLEAHQKNPDFLEKFDSPESIRNGPKASEKKDPTKNIDIRKYHESHSKESKKLFKEFLTRLESGEDVSPDEYLTNYPDLADELRRFFGRLLGSDKKQSGEEPESSQRDTSTTADKRSSRVFGDFRIVREIGKGGMGTVYEAEQMSLKRRVALKVLPSHLSFSNEAVLRFKREAEAGGRQSHPGIVSIYAVGKHEDTHYIAQELVEGGITLEDELDEFREGEEQPLGYFRDVAQLVVEVADALDQAHKSGVIHRDIKPSNILITNDGRPKVTDFGIAKIEDALALSRTGDFTGTPYYMSPEQAMSHRIGIDKRTDIYSLGVTLYELLTFSLPFEGDTSHEILKKIVFVDPQDPQKANARVPRDLSTLCLKAMEKLPEKRYQSMKEFSEDLQVFLRVM